MTLTAPRIAAVLTVFGQPEAARQCIGRLLEQTVPLFRICAVLNGVADEVAAPFTRDFAGHPSVQILRSLENVGNSAGVRLAMRAVMGAGAEWIWILEDDALPRVNAVERLVADGLDSDCVYSSLVVDPRTGEPAFPYSVIHGPDGKRVVQTLAALPPERCFSINGSWLGALIPRAIIEKVGEVNAELFLRGEDEEYPARIRAAGHRFLCVKDSLVEHSAQNLLRIRVFGANFFYETRLPLWKAYYVIRNHAFVRTRYAGGMFPGLIKALGTVALASVFALFFDDRKLARCLLYLRAGWHGFRGDLSQGRRPGAARAPEGSKATTVLIVRAMRGDFASMDVYADGLAAGLRGVRPDWEIVEIEPRVLPNQKICSRLARSINGVKRYIDRFARYPLRIRRCKADIVHIVSDQYFHCAYFAKSSGAGIIATCHDLYHFTVKENIVPYAAFIGVSRAALRVSLEGLKYCDRIITVSAETGNEAQRFLGIARARLARIGNAVGERFVPLSGEQRQRARKRLNLPDDRFCLLHVGTAAPHKNVETVLQLLCSLKAIDFPAHLAKAGNVFSARQQAYIEGHGLASSISHLGFLKNSDLVEVYNACDAFVFPSLNEGMPFVLLEAMACGLPIIASNIPMHGEALGDAAILLPPLAVEQWVEAVILLSKEPARRESLIRAALDRVALMRWPAVASRVAELYESVLRERPKR